MDNLPSRAPGGILWLNVLTVVSAAILISAEVFGAAFAAAGPSQPVRARLTRSAHPRRAVRALRQSPSWCSSSSRAPR